MTREKKELLKQLRAIEEKENFEYGTDPCFLPQHILDDRSARNMQLKQPILMRLNELMHNRVNDYFGVIVLKSEENK